MKPIIKAYQRYVKGKSKSVKVLQRKAKRIMRKIGGGIDE
jgi:hypothetical protein